MGDERILRTMKRLATFLASAALMIPAVMQAKPAHPVSRQEAVRHELAMMSRYTAFDDISFRLDGDTVILTGEVHTPIVKSDAKDAVRHVEGVSKVINNIEVLPLSPNDDRVRLAVYRAIYGAPTLSARYAQLAYPPIHIIVKNGHVRLEGFVANQMDRNIAGIRANGVFGAFTVQNDLKVD
jgi:hyperosmotically inducible protein